MMLTLNCISTLEPVALKESVHENKSNDSLHSFVFKSVSNKNSYSDEQLTSSTDLQKRVKESHTTCQEIHACFYTYRDCLKILCIGKDLIIV